MTRGTPLLSPIIKWNHKIAWKTYKFSTFSVQSMNQIKISLSYFDEELKFLSGHVIDGRNLVPATMFLYVVWNRFCDMFRKQVEDCPIKIENCKFIRAAVMSPSSITSFVLSFQRTSGYFEITQNNALLVSGKITLIDRPNTIEKTVTKVYNQEHMLQQDEIYRELYLRGYNYT